MSHVMKPSALKKCGSTNRNENYPTPTPLVRMMVKQGVITAHYARYTNRGSAIHQTTVRVLDLCAGSAVWGIVAKQELEKLGFDVHLTAIESDKTILPAPEVDTWICNDFKNVTGLEKFDYIFSNPPFSEVYAVTLWSVAHLTPWGIFGLLIGSNFMFAHKDSEALLAVTTPLYEVKLTRRPSFKYTFAKKRGDKKGKGTSAKDYNVYFFGGKDLNDGLRYHMQDVHNYLSLPYVAKEWPTYTQYWDYAEDPLDAILEERPVTVQQALIREAAEAKGYDYKFDYDIALLAANEYGWDFFYADSKTRFDMLDQLEEKMAMIYTIGNVKSYFDALQRSENGTITKVGRGGEYVGGFAFKTYDDARNFITEQGYIGYGVFGLDAVWERDTEPSKHSDKYHNLLVDAEIIFLTDVDYDNP